MSSPFIIDELSAKINELNSGLSSSIDLINTNINTINTDLSAVATNVVINNTASTTGTLSQKLSSIYNQIGSTSATGGSVTNGSIMQKLNTLLLNQCSSIAPGNSFVKFNPITSEKVWSPNDGTYSNFVASTSSSSGDGYHYLPNGGGDVSYCVCTDMSQPFYVENMKFTATRDGKLRMNVSMKVQNSNYPIYAVVTSGGYWGKIEDNFVAGTGRIYTTSYTSKTVDFSVKKGTTYYISILANRSGVNFKFYCNNLSITYDIETNSSIV